MTWCGKTLLAQDHCWIKYSYDAAGNRIERRWWCGDPHVLEGGPKMMAESSFGLTLAPNPTRDLLSLTSETEMANATVTITNSEGRAVQTIRMNGKRMELDVSTYDAGAYMLVLRNGQEEYQKRFTVVH